MEGPIADPVCIFELKRKGALLTADVVCMVCGVHLSSQQDRPPGKRQGRTGRWCQPGVQTPWHTTFRFWSLWRL